MAGGDLETTFNMSDIQSERSSYLKTKENSNAGADKMILRAELEDTVVVVEWSQKDAWVFASASYNGTLVVATVPSKEKYRILL